MIPSTPAYSLQRAVAAAVTAGAFATLGVAAQKPFPNLPGAFSFSGFVDSDVGNIDVTGNGIFFKIVGTAADNATITLRLTGWKPLGDDQWIAETLCEVTATLCTAVLSGEERLADTIVKVSGPDNMQIKSFTDNRPGSVLVDALGCPILQIQAQTNDANILWAPI